MQVKMLPKGQELNEHETRIISEDVLLFSQIFGGLPLKYVKHPNNKAKLEFCKALQIFGIAYIACLTGMSCAGLYIDYTRYLSGEQLVMSTTIVFADIVLLNVIAMIVTVTGGRRYDKLVDMCLVLQGVDTSLQQNSDIPTSRFKVLVTFALTTAVLVSTLASQIVEKSITIMIYSHKVCMYYTLIAVYLLFTFLTTSLTLRFRRINEKIQQEVLALKLRPLTEDLSLSNIIPGNECSMDTLIRSYTQLYEALQLANSFYQSQLFATVCFSFLQNTMSLYEFFVSIWSTRTLVSGLALFNAGLGALFHVSYLTLLIWPTNILTHEAGKTAPLVCQLLSKDLNDAELTDQLETFLLQLRHYKVEFSAFGFFQMNSHLLPLIASSVTTYLVILIQLKLNNS